MLHEAVEAFGVGAEIVARMADVGFDELDGPIVRVGAPFMPVPFAKALKTPTGRSPHALSRPCAGCWSERGDR